MKLLSLEPTKWTDIDAWFNKTIDIPIGSSEVYKHFKLMRDEGYIAQVNGKYTITKKGFIALESVKKLAETEPKLPKIKVEF